ncbi:YwqG family protein [Sphingomonas sp.]|uniref:YwqG family protein n=1 Tax=Sphingomonas sp. TaxID=28214 RepID=UPI002ED85547
MTDFALALLAAFAVVPWLLYFYWKGVVRRRERQAMEAPAWGLEEEGPPLTEGEVREFEKFLVSLALPAVELHPDPDATIYPGGTRLGGPVWLVGGEDWPNDRQGRPMEFLAQIDFATLPALPDFPTRGILQFFIGTDDGFGADFDDPSASDFAARWRETIEGAGQLVAPPELGDESRHSPWMKDDARAAGVALVGRAAVQHPSWSDARVEARTGAIYKRPGFRALEDRLAEGPDAPRPVHHSGGHPVFTQQDFRRGEYRDYDHCLLRLTSDEFLQWGNVGEAVFLIRAEDLRRRDWTRIAYSWDCY